MKTFVTSVVTLILVFGLLTPDVRAQRGVGEPSGVARQAVKPEVVTFSGKLVEIKTGPCEKTTGRSPLGTHLILETADGKKLNIHLGPATAVADLVAKLSVGQSLTVKAFRTEKLPDGQFVAQTVTFGDNTIELRDQGLRPVWAQGNADAGSAGTAVVPGRGGRGLGWGGGSGRGAGWGRGRGAGWGGPPWSR